MDLFLHRYHDRELYNHQDSNGCNSIAADALEVGEMARSLLIPALTVSLMGICAAQAQPLASTDVQSQARLIASDDKGAGDGSISADGRYLVASSTRLKGQSSIWLFDRKVGTWRQLTEPGNGDREPAISPNGRFVVFISDRKNRTDLWAIDTGSGRQFALTEDSAEEEYPAWSKDGKQIVFTGGPWKERNFYTFKIGQKDGRILSPPTPALTRTGHVGACNFRADGKLICHVYQGSSGDLIEVDPITHKERRITRGGWWFYKPDVAPDGWVAVTVIGGDGEMIRFMPAGGTGDPLPSPAIKGSWPQFAKNGRELIFHRTVNEGVGLKLLDLQSGNVQTLEPAGKLGSSAAISPDGTLVAYCRIEGDRSSVRLLRIADGKDWPLQVDESTCNPSWAPDGKRLALSLRKDGHWAQAVVGTDGSGLRILRDGSGTEWQFDAPASWSPDGQKLAFAANTAPYESDLFVADLPSGAVRNITKDTWFDEGPTWSADGKSIVFMSTRGGSWTWGLFAIPAAGGEARVLVEPDSIERRFPQLDGDGTVWWIESDLCLGSTYLVRRMADGSTKKFYDLPGAAGMNRTGNGKVALLPISRQRVEYWSLPMSSSHGSRSP